MSKEYRCDVCGKTEMAPPNFFVIPNFYGEAMAHVCSECREKFKSLEQTHTITQAHHDGIKRLIKELKKCWEDGEAWVSLGCSASPFRCDICPVFAELGPCSRIAEAKLFIPKSGPGLLVGAWYLKGLLKRCTVEEPTAKTEKKEPKQHQETQNQIIALEKTIAHWGNLTWYGKGAAGPAECALCKYNHSCPTCIIYKDTGKKNCEGTPYSSVVVAAAGYSPRVIPGRAHIMLDWLRGLRDRCTVKEEAAK